jgi:hypothetical protein
MNNSSAARISVAGARSLTKDTTMNSAKWMNRGLGLTAALLTLSAEPARAAEEVVVYGRALPAAIRDEHRLYKSELEQYLRAFNEQLKATLDQDLKRDLAKRDLAPKVEIAARVTPTRG